jgi:hypothetical protein
VAESQFVGLVGADLGRSIEQSATNGRDRRGADSLADLLQVAASIRIAVEQIAHLRPHISGWVVTKLASLFRAGGRFAGHGSNP